VEKGQPKLSLSEKITRLTADYEAIRQALVAQAEATQAALTSQKAEIESLRNTIAPTVERVINEAFKSLPLQITQGAGGGFSFDSIVSLALARMFGIGGPQYGQIPSDLIPQLNDLNSTFYKVNIAVMKNLMMKQMRDIGMPTHELVGHGMELTKP
jgi:hypothetical protein